MGYKAYWAIILWRMGIRKILPSGYINKKHIYENNSPLVDISQNTLFSIDKRAKDRGGLWVRKELETMLINAAHLLPQDIKLHFFAGWRHIAVQWIAWEKNLSNKRQQYPNATNKELLRLARLTSADPSRGDYGPHQTGGAIDITLIKDGKELDMGTPYAHHGIESQTDFKNLTEEQRQNRNLLCYVLQQAGFINYPREWWHYSYGDRAWAAYGHKKFALYGCIDNPDYKLKAEELKFQKR